MKKYLFQISLFCLLFLAMPKQVIADEYHELLKESINSDLLSDDGELQQLIPLLQASMGEDVGNLFAEYAQKQLADDIATMYEPTYKKYVSADDLKWIIAWEKNERNKEINRKVIAKVSAINQDSQIMQYLQEIATGISNIMKGESVTPLSEISCTNSFRKAFNQYIESANLQEVMQQMMDGVMAQMAKQNKLSTSQLSEQTKKALSTYSFEATQNLCLLLLKDTLSEEDLLFVAQNTQSVEYQHLQKAAIELASNPDLVGNGLLEGFSKWVEATHPDKKEAVEKLKNR